jgi:hypothetical protein
MSLNKAILKLKYSDKITHSVKKGSVTRFFTHQAGAGLALMIKCPHMKNIDLSTNLLLSRALLWGT